MSHTFNKIILKFNKRLNKFFHRQSYVILFLFITAFLLRLPLLHTEFDRLVDAFEYINVAQNIASGQGFIKTIKIDFFDDKPIIGPGNLLRPMFTPLVYTPLVMLSSDYATLQLFNLLLAAVNVVLFYFLVRKFCNTKESFIAALLIAFNPNIVITSRFIASEQIFIFLVLSFFIVYYRQPQKKIYYVLLGIIASLAYLTRVEGVLLLIVLGLISYRKIPLFLIALTSFVIIALPNFIFNYLSNGNLFHTVYGYHFVIHYWAVGSEYFYHNFPTPIEFMLNNTSYIFKTLLAFNIGSIQSLIGFRSLGILSIFILYFLIVNYRKLFQLHTIDKITPIILFTFFFYIINTFIWSVFYAPERHLALVYICLVLVFFASIINKFPKKLVYSAIGFTMIIYMVYNIHQIHWARQSIGIFEKRQSNELYHWIRENTKKSDVIATRIPAPLAYFTHRPTILIPLKFPKEIKKKNDFKEYLTKYNVKYIYAEDKDLDLYLDKENFTKVTSSDLGRLYIVNKKNYE